MPRQRDFYMIVVDDDARTFNVQGPMSNDEPLNEAVVKAKGQGRNIRCMTVDDARSYAEALAAGIAAGWTPTNERIV